MGANPCQGHRRLLRDPSRYPPPSPKLFQGIAAQAASYQHKYALPFASFLALVFVRATRFHIVVFFGILSREFQCVLEQIFEFFPRHGFSEI
jgi:hypothetical protein